MKNDTKSQTTHRHSFIETLLAWSGEVHAAEVASYFHVARQTAQGFIDDYRNTFPGQMEYDSRRKRHVPSKAFHPQITTNQALAFLDLVRGQTLEGRYWDCETVSNVPLTDVDRLGRPELPNDTIQTLLLGLARRKRVSIRYQSKATDPNAIAWRMISPNHLVHADNRYHIRAYCNDRQAYRDFVLSRIVHAELQDNEKPGAQWVSGDDDTAWRTTVTLCFYPNPDLTAAQRQATTHGYSLDTQGCYAVRTSQALAFYVKRKMLVLDQVLGMPRWCLSNDY